MQPMRAALEALQKALKERPHKYLRRVATGRTTSSGSPIYRYCYVNPAPGRAFSVEIPGDGGGEDANGWDDARRRDAAVVAALRAAGTSVSRIEAALRGVRHREFVVGIGRHGLKVRASHLLPRAEVDHPRIIMGNPDVRVPFPKDADIVVVTHNHAAMTPLSGGDIASTIKNGVRTVRVVSDGGGWQFTFNAMLPTTPKELVAIGRGLDTLRESASLAAMVKMPAGSVLDLESPGGHRLKQVAEAYVDTWNEHLDTALHETWGPVFAHAGVEAEFGHLPRPAGGLAKGEAPDDLRRAHELLGSHRSGRRGSGPPEGLKLDKASGVHHVPYDFHPVEVHAPQRKRAKFPFQGFIDFQGLKIDVENLAGSYREGGDGDGHQWRVKMHAHYGEVRGTEGVDGDPLDVYVLPNADSSLVVVVHQNDPVTGDYDEDKVVLGAKNVAEALALYSKQYDRPGFYGGHTAMPIGAFWRWVHDRNRHGAKVTKEGVMHAIWVPISKLVYDRLLGLSKAAGHKYLKRVPAGVDPRTGKQRWRYYYKVTGGKGQVAHEDDLVKVGAKFMLRDGEHDGHFEVKAVDGDEVTLVHDESGRELKMSVRELKLRLHRQHARAIVDQRNQARERRMREYQQAKKTGSKKQQERAKSRARAAGAEVEDEAGVHAAEVKRLHSDLKRLEQRRGWRNRVSRLELEKREALRRHLGQLRNKRLASWSPEGPDTTGLEDIVDKVDANSKKRVAFRESVKRHLRSASLTKPQLKDAIGRLDAHSTGKPFRSRLRAGGAAARKAEDAYHEALQAARAKHGDVDLTPIGPATDEVSVAHRRLKQDLDANRDRHVTGKRDTAIQSKWGLTRKDRLDLVSSLNMGGQLETDEQIERALQMSSAGHPTWFDGKKIKPVLSTAYARGLATKVGRASVHVYSGDAGHDAVAAYYARMVADTADAVADHHSEELAKIRSGRAADILASRERLLSKIESVEARRGGKTPLGDSLRQQISAMHRRRADMEKMQRPGDFVRYELAELKSQHPAAVAAIRRAYPGFAAGRQKLPAGVGAGPVTYHEPPEVKYTTQTVDIEGQKGRTPVKAQVSGGWAIHGDRSGWTVTDVRTGLAATPPHLLRSKASADWLVRRLHEAGHGAGYDKDSRDAMSAIVQSHMQSDDGIDPPWSSNRAAKAARRQQDRATKAADKMAQHSGAPTGGFAVNSQHRTSDDSIHKRLKRFASTESTRSNLNHIAVQDGMAVATDGHRAVRVPTKGVRDGFMHREAKERTYAPADFPARTIRQLYDRAGEHAENTHHVDAEGLRAAAEAAIAHHAATKAGDVPRVALVHQGGGFHWQVANEGHGKPTTQIAGKTVTAGKDPAPVFLNAKYVKDALSGASGTVRVRSTGSADPIRIDRGDGEEHIIMPTRVDKGEREKLLKGAARPFTTLVKAWAAARVA